MSALSAAMSEAQLQDAIIEAAKLYGWRCAHFRPAMTVRGWRTPVQGDAGFPDLVLARLGKVMFLELKREGGRVSPDQQAWLNDLDTDSPHCWSAVVYPHQLDWILERLR